MLLLDDILMLPVSGVKFVLRTLHQAALQEWTDPAPLKQRLLELQEQLEDGAITEAQYAEAEAEVFRGLREIERRKRELAGEGEASGKDQP